MLDRPEANRPNSPKSELAGWWEQNLSFHPSWAAGTKSLLKYIRALIFRAVQNHNADGNNPEYLVRDGKRFRQDKDFHILYHQDGKDPQNGHHSHQISFDKNEDEHTVDGKNPEYFWRDGKLYRQDKNLHILYHKQGPIATQKHNLDKSIAKARQNVNEFKDNVNGFKDNVQAALVLAHGPLRTHQYQLEKSVAKTQQNVKQFVDNLRKRVKENGEKRKAKHWKGIK